MVFKQLHINRTSQWDVNPNTLCGSVTFESPDSEVKIQIDDETAREIVVMCSRGIVHAAQAVAAKTVQSLNLLEAPRVQENSDVK